jgi:hypothetical protein
MSGYVYRGNQRDEKFPPTIIRKPPRNSAGRYKIAPCGTESGYKRHLRDNEWACDPCKIANAKSKTLKRGGKPTGKVRELAPCGTTSAYHRHQRNGEQPCLPCRLAHAKDCAARARPFGPLAPPKDTGACGTEKGYQRHKRALQLACDPCKAARAAETKKYREAIGRKAA